MAAAARDLQAGGPPYPITVSRLSFESGGRNIHAECYMPVGVEPRATILLLHGAGGTLLEGHKTIYLAEALARAGNAAYFVRYFDRTGTLFSRWAVMEENFDTWLATVRDAIAWVDDRQGATRRPIGVYGYSLGGFLALAAASDDPRVGAVIEQGGGVWDAQADRIERMPPVLVVHGFKDDRIPFEVYAQPLMGLLRRRGDAFQTCLFPQEGHSFNETDMARVRKTAVGFFRAKLDARSPAALARDDRRGRRTRTIANGLANPRKFRISRSSFTKAPGAI